LSLNGNYDLHLIKLDTAADQFKIFKKIYRNFDTVFMLESLVGPKELSEISIIGFDPTCKVIIDNENVCVKKGNKSIQSGKPNDPLLPVKRIIPRVGNKRFRYVGGAVGYVSYDAVNFYENLRTKSKKKRSLSDYFPILEFGIYTDGIIVDHSETKVYYFYQGKTSRSDQVIRLLKGSDGRDNEERFYYSEPVSNLSENQYMNMVKEAKNYVYQGDVFQVVLSRNLHFNVQGDALSVYENLRKINPSPYMYLLKTGRMQIIGSSPEMLLRVSKNYLETYPIAGTRPVVSDPALNKKLMRDLVNDKKEISEHTMLVDLARNDVGRVCEYGSVHVKDLMAVRRFSHVQHMVTHVSGSLRDTFDAFDAFRALFPAGTVSGAPKLRAMEIIDELEPSRRGPYAGALGYFSSNGSCDFAIIIRSIFIQERKAYSQAGAGIVIESDPQKEWKETGQKLDAMLLALHGSDVAKKKSTLN
jgi:anthranilate synthase component 1